MKKKNRLGLSLLLMGAIFATTITSSYAISEKKSTELGTVTANLGGYKSGVRKHGVADTTLPQGKRATKIGAKLAPKIYSTGASAGDGEILYLSNAWDVGVDWECHTDKYSAQTLKYFSTHEVIHSKSTVIYMSLAY